MTDGLFATHCTVDRCLIHVHNVVGCAIIAYKAGADVLKEVESFCFDFTRIALSHVCGNTMREIVPCKEPGKTNLCGRLGTLAKFRVQLIGLSQEGETIHIDSLLPPLLDEIEKLLFNFVDETCWAAMKGHLSSLGGVSSKFFDLLSPPTNYRRGNLNNMGCLGEIEIFVRA